MEALLEFADLPAGAQFAWNGWVRRELEPAHPTVRIPAERGVSAPDDSVGGTLLEPAVLEGTAVLVVDDQPDVCELAERSLETLNRETATARW